MTQEDKESLLKDLSARLPYGVKVNIKGLSEPKELYSIAEEDGIFYINGYYSVEEVKPHLRPMSSMAEEELREFAELKFKNDDVWEIDEFPEMKFGFKGFINIRCRNRNSGDTWTYQVNTRTPIETYWGTDWLNAHNFDYRGLIPKGLAIKVTEENNPYENAR